MAYCGEALAHFGHHRFGIGGGAAVILLQRLLAICVAVAVGLGEFGRQLDAREIAVVFGRLRLRDQRAKRAVARRFAGGDARDGLVGDARVHQLARREYLRVARWRDRRRWFPRSHIARCRRGAT